MCHQSPKSVQIHHLDEDPSNNAPDNLAVLCLECHDQTQVRGGFGRRVDAAQVRIYRDEWYRTVESRRALLQQPAQVSLPEPQGRNADLRLEHDKEIFQRAQAILSEDALRRFLEPLFEADEYLAKDYIPVKEYFRFLSAADNEFVSDELQVRCQAMLRAFNVLFNFLAYNFFPFGDTASFERLVLHPRLNVDRGGEIGGMAEYAKWQENLDNILDSAYIAWREFRRAVKQLLIT